MIRTCPTGTVRLSEAGRIPDNAFIFEYCAGEDDGIQEASGGGPRAKTAGLHSHPGLEANVSVRQTCLGP